MRGIKNRFWVLGAQDGEMQLIKYLLDKAGERYIQPRVEWGDHEYGKHEIILGPQSRKLKVIYFVECKPKAKDELKHVTIRVLDHHGERSGEEASIYQVFHILEKAGFCINWQERRWMKLVAANDCGGYAGLEKIHAKPAEIEYVRELTRRAQGVTVQHEIEAARAVKKFEAIGKVAVVRMPHNKFAAVLDLFYRKGRKDNILVIGDDGQINFFGDGAVCHTLYAKFDGSWAGGDGFRKPGDIRAYWGCSNGANLANAVLHEANRSL